jgi:hypothetical protein
MNTAIIAVAAALLLLAVPAWAQECSEEVVLETMDGTIVLHHYEALYNCCACVDVEVAQDGFEVDFLEREDFGCGVCWCECCFSIDARVSGLVSGNYTVRVWKLYDNGDGTWTEELVGTWTVEVTGHSEPSLWSTYIPCASSADPEGPLAWSVIKALYR